MEQKQFEDLIGTDTIVQYQFGNELQLWNLKNFTRDPDAVKAYNAKWQPETPVTIVHNRLPINAHNFAKHAVYGKTIYGCDFCRFTTTEPQEHGFQCPKNCTHNINTSKSGILERKEATHG